MKTVLSLMVLLSSALAHAEESPLILRNRFGDQMFAVLGVGDLLYGSDATLLTGARPYRRAGGAVGFGFGTEAVLTSFGAVAGVEAEAELGASSGNQHSDGFTRFNETGEREADSLPIGLSLKLGGRVKISPVWFHFSERVGLRLGLMAGLAVDWFAVQAFDQVGSYNLGAQFVFQAPSFSVTLSGLFTPPQGNDWELTRLNGSVMLTLGQFIIGARTSLTNARFRNATPMRPAGLVAEQSFSAFLGVAFGGD